MTSIPMPEACNAWCDGFLTAMEAIGVDNTAELLAAAMPEPILRGLVRAEAQEMVNRWVQEGRFVRLTDNRIVPTADYDPATHGPVVQS